jgi:hypothetical protein
MADVDQGLLGNGDLGSWIPSGEMLSPTFRTILSAIAGKDKANDGNNSDSVGRGALLGETLWWKNGRILAGGAQTQGR